VKTHGIGIDQRSGGRRWLATRFLAGLAIATAIVAQPAAASDARQARSADSFVDSIGVNTHTFFDDTAYYSQFDLVTQRLAELGVRHVREELVPDRPDQYERLGQLAAIGIASDLILGDPSDGAEQLDVLTSILRSDLNGAVDAVEGPNEFDASGDPGWQPRLAEYQQQLYAKLKVDASLASLPVIGPSIVHRQSRQAIGDISAMLDYGNIHPYPNGATPEANLSFYLEGAALNSGSKPVMATETGYHNALNWTGEHAPTSEEATAIYLPRLFLEYFRRGIARTYAYELLDHGPDPGLGERELHFGLLRNDFSEKPAFVALRNTIEILRDPGPGFDGSPLAYAVDGDRGSLREVLLQKRDGSFYLALWRATGVWDPQAGTPLDPGSAPVTLAFGRRLEGAQLFLPNRSADPTRLRLNGDRSLTVDVGPRVAILKLELGASNRGRIKLWVSSHSVAPGGRLTVRGRLPDQASGRLLRVKVQRWHRGWRTVGRSRTSRLGVFRKRIRLPGRTAGKSSRLRVVARAAKPSKAVRVRIRATR
jgi:hypothetical protein